MTRIVRWLSALDLRWTAAVLFGSILLVGLVGVVTLWVDPGNAWLDLDSELGLGWPPSEITLAFPAIWSACLLAFGGVAWLAVSWTLPVELPRAAALGFGALLLALAFDELFKVHERLEARSGIDWQLIYLPVAAVGVVLLAALAWRFRPRGHGIAPMLVGGGACWAVAAALEYVQWRGDEEVELYAFFMVPEEMLELAGSALLALAAISTLQVVVGEWRDGWTPGRGHSTIAQTIGAQLRSLAPLIMSVVALSVLFVVAALLIAGSRGESANDLLADMYELTGSRLTGFISIVGVMVLTATAAITLFAARITWRLPRSQQWARFLLGAGLLTALLAIDDYLSVHELADDVLAALTGIEAERALKNLLEAGVLGVYGLLLAVLLWWCRSTVASTEWTLLAIAGVMLMASLAFDMAPHSWLAGTFGISLDAQALAEDWLKLTGIAFYAIYLTRTSARAIRRPARDAV